MGKQLAEAEALLKDVQERQLDDDRVRRVQARRDELADLVEQLSHIVEDHAAVIQSLDDKPIGRYKAK